MANDTERFTVLDLLKLDLQENEALDLRCVGGRAGLAREITIPELNRPGLALSGFYDNFAFGRVQLFGRGENAFLKKLSAEGDDRSLREFFGYDVPCSVFTHSLTATPEFLRLSEEANCPVLQSGLSSSEFTSRVVRALNSVFAPHCRMHGVLVEVFGVGVLIQGPSGVGKSEAALALIERGHRLVADDVVEVRRVGGNVLIGRGAEIASHHMEIRGLGIINVAHLFGVGAIRESKQIQLSVQLEEWDSSRNYDRIGAEDRTVEIIGTHVHHVLIPVRPGRNIPIIIETAAMNERLKHMGYHSAREFNHNVSEWMESKHPHAAAAEEW